MVLKILQSDYHATIAKPSNLGGTVGNFYTTRAATHPDDGKFLIRNLFTSITPMIPKISNISLNVNIQKSGPITLYFQV